MCLQESRDRGSRERTVGQKEKKSPQKKLSPLKCAESSSRKICATSFQHAAHAVEIAPSAAPHLCDSGQAVIVSRYTFAVSSMKLVGRLEAMPYRPAEPPLYFSGSDRTYRRKVDKPWASGKAAIGLLRGGGGRGRKPWRQPPAARRRTASRSLRSAA